MLHGYSVPYAWEWFVLVMRKSQGVGPFSYQKYQKIVR